MRTMTAPVTARCGHCSLPESLHTSEQRATCERRLLADLSRSWPRRMPTQAERDALAVKKLDGAILALAEARRTVDLSPDERRKFDAAVDVLGTHLARRRGS